MKTSRRTKVLFMGEMISSHAQSWVGLLDDVRDEFELLGFGVPGSPYPVTSKLPLFNLPYQSLTSEKIPNWFRKLVLHFVIRTFRPDVIHTFAAFPTSALYAPIIRQYQPKIKWVMQVRGGPDVYMNRHIEERKAVLSSLFHSCDILIADNDINYSIAKEMGLPLARCWEYGIAPGTGGVELDDFNDAIKPSQAEKRVVWTKAYEGYESKGLPVLEAIKLAWPSIRGTKFLFAAVNPDIENHVKILPQEIQDHIELTTRMPREKILQLMKASRVVMAPSMLEGIPNSLYEAMASQCVPIFSPLETYFDKFKNKENIIYAQNLRPEEIAEALILALTDDAMADRIAANNTRLVSEIANRNRISEHLVRLYHTLAHNKGYK